jgi:hypothetical protein
MLKSLPPPRLPVKGLGRPTPPVSPAIGSIACTREALGVATYLLLRNAYELMIT